jgi:hypothetical protein
MTSRGERGREFLAKMNKYYRDELGIQLGLLGILGPNSLSWDIVELIKYEEDPDTPYEYKLTEALLAQYNGASFNIDDLEMFVQEIPPIPDNKYHEISLFTNIEKMHNIPKGLTIFRIREPLLTELPELPEGLEHFEIREGKFSTLPILPASIMHLLIPMNKFTVLPDLSHFEHLQELDCDANQLTELPALPVSLMILTCASNQLKKLPILPSALAVLDCAYNQLEELPDVAHCKQLWSINCSYNSIRNIPTELPATLIQFEYSHNPIDTPPSRVYKNMSDICSPPAEIFTVRAWKNISPPTYERQKNNYTMKERVYPKILEKIRALKEEEMRIRVGESV